MHCSECNTVIRQAVKIVETEGRNYGMEEEEDCSKLYCKNCFKREFDIK